jgi:CHAT domain-containing protein/tetratricopeptide (TPR) repeat protein
MLGSKMWQRGLGLLGALGMLAGISAADDPPGKSPPATPPWQRLLKGEDARNAEQLSKRASALVQAGKFEEALAAAEQLVRIRQQRQGKEHFETVSAAFAADAIRRVLRGSKEDREAHAASFALIARAASLEQKGQYREALPLREQVSALRQKLLGEDHPDTALSHAGVAANLNAQGKYREAEAGYRKALEIDCKALGEQHPITAQACNDLGEDLHLQGRYQDAEEDFRKALAIRQAVLGEDSADTAESYNDLALSLQHQGRHREAEEGHRKALAIYRKVLSEEHPYTALAYNNVAGDLHAQGRYQEAEESFRKSLDICRKVLGEQHPYTFSSYNNVASNLKAQGRNLEAEAGYRKALALALEVHGGEHPDTATASDNLADALFNQGKYTEAEPHLRQALAIRRKALGEEHPMTANSYNNVAVNLQLQGRSVEAEEGYKKALAISRKALGENNPLTAGIYEHLAENLKAQGRYTEAEENYRKALAIRRRLLGEEHLETAESYYALGATLRAEGRYAQAEDLYVRGADAFLVSRLLISASGLGRAARTSQNSPLHELAALLARNGKPDAAWQRFEQGLGRGIWDDLSARLRRPAKELGRQTELVLRLERLDQLLAPYSGSGELTPAQEKERTALLDRRREAHAELTAFQHHLEEAYGPAQGQVFDRAEIQRALPADTALVAWIDVTAGPRAADRNGEHWAVLLRSQGEPVFQRLRGSGPGGDWTDEDTQLPQRLRTALQSPEGEWRRLAQRLRRQRLQLLDSSLKAGEKLPAVRHLVMLPSAALAGVPLEVLAEDITVSYAASGTLYAHLGKQPAVKSTGLLAVADPVFESAAPAGKDRLLPPGGVLLTVVAPESQAAQAKLRVGDVLLQYADVPLKTADDLKTALAAADPKAQVPLRVWRDGATFERKVGAGKLGVVLADKPAREALAERYRVDRLLASRRGDESWAALPGTRVEVESLHRLFGDRAALKLLFDSEASEQQLDELAHIGALSKYRYLHLATHGEVDDAFPLRSALILSRDTLPDPQKQLLAGKPVYDARLTAEEMLRSWNLNADLVTLSACQTALGKYEKGEGFVGFAQALMLCGSRSVCLSLWKVDDAATALLMQRFYANLLGKPDGLKTPLAKAAALREAKEWLRNLSRTEALRVAAKVSQGVERGKGRPRQTLLPPLPEPAGVAEDNKPYAHPYYWAAFVLIGDPD